MDEQTSKKKYIANPHLKVIRISSNELLIKHSMNSVYSKLIEDVNCSGLLGDILDFFKREKCIEDFYKKVTNKSNRMKEIDYFLKIAKEIPF